MVKNQRRKDDGGGFHAQNKIAKRNRAHTCLMKRCQLLRRKTPFGPNEQSEQRRTLAVRQTLQSS